MQAYATWTDEQLMESYYNSAEESEANAAFGEMDRRYRTRLILSLTQAGYHRCFVKLPRMAGRDEKADELAAEALFKAADTRGRPSARWHASLGSVRGWLFGILRNAAISYLRQKHPGVRVEAGPEARADAGPAAEAAARPLPDEAVQHRAMVTAMRECLNELPPNLRVICEMIYDQGMKQADVADLLKLSQSTLTRRKQEAYERLRECLRRKGIIREVLG
jgi:RNA polymerase sigma factor (sigma-70 family)